ncbi:hypothetical protein BG910_04865 [Neisseria chenwenguii]|uniref:Uncharacterized protein n=1 Tax=Neisseria chenwenguii TaxID=1853278 RepID=A0A220S1B6_9NEIS|nr:hypothetical protein BG910_04865 [Neisseria chenwenguii]
MGISRRLHPNRPEHWAGIHVLKCTHSLNSRSKIDYLMYCGVLKKMTEGRLKIRVYGSRYVLTEGSRIRYAGRDAADKAGDRNIGKETS